MCGRYSVRDPRRCLAEFSILEKEPALEPRYNIAPSQRVPAIRVLPPEMRPRLDWLHWGLAAAGRPASAGVTMVRVESVTRRPAFAASFRWRRCLLLADGFYEWKRRGTQSFPYYVRQPDGAPFAIAAIWQYAAVTAGGAVDSCAIITRPARPPVDAVHDRMPAIVDRRHRDKWLDPNYGDIVALIELLAADSGVCLTAASVGARVNSPSHDDVDCVAPVPESERHGEQFELWPSSAAAGAGQNPMRRAR